jgi:hypothetical protein
MMPSVDFPVGRQSPRIAAFLSTITLLAVAGCGGTGGVHLGGPPPAPDTGGSNGPNAAPTITGTPAGSAVPGESYTFTPSASDPNGDSITFAIQNRPAWANFDTRTGRLAGTPTEAQIGMYANVVITASDGTAQTSMPAFSINVAAIGVGNGTAELTWVAPTLRSDGSPLTNLAGYRVYYGRAANRYTNTVDLNVGVSTHVVDNLAAGTWYFAVSAIDARGAESALTAPATKIIG